MWHIIEKITTNIYVNFHVNNHQTLQWWVSYGLYICLNIKFTITKAWHKSYNYMLFHGNIQLHMRKNDLNLTTTYGIYWTQFFIPDDNTSFKWLNHPSHLKWHCQLHVLIYNIIITAEVVHVATYNNYAWMNRFDRVEISPFSHDRKRFIWHHIDDGRFISETLCDLRERV